MADEKYVRVRLVRSLIGYSDRQRRTVQALGLRNVHDEVVHRATPAILGMCKKIPHLVEWEEVDSAEVETA